MVVEFLFRGVLLVEHSFFVPAGMTRSGHGLEVFEDISAHGFFPSGRPLFAGASCATTEHLGVYQDSDLPVRLWVTGERSGVDGDVSQDSFFQLAVEV